MNHVRDESTLTRRIRLERKGQDWRGGEGDVASETIFHETIPYDPEARPRRHMLKRKEKRPDPEIIPESIPDLILTYNEIKIEEEIQEIVPKLGSRSEDEAKQVVENKRETVDDSVTLNSSVTEGCEVLNPKVYYTSYSNQTTGSGRLRLQRGGKPRPGRETGSVDEDTEMIKLNDRSSYIPKNGSERQRLQRKEKNWTGIRKPSSASEKKAEEKLDDKKRMDITLVLSAKLISDIISFTTPRDASKSSLVCSAFKSAADSDSVWEKFLPPYYEGIISSSISDLTSLSKKALYFHLCHNPILTDTTMSFALDRETGEPCYMLGARGLSIEGGNSPDQQHWKWLSLPEESRFSEVAQLIECQLLDVKASFETNGFTSETKYAAYFVFKFVDNSFTRQEHGARYVDVDVYFGGDDQRSPRRVSLDPSTDVSRKLSQGGEGKGWIKIEMGEFEFLADQTSLVCSVSNREVVAKRGIIVEGIELRPKCGR